MSCDTQVFVNGVDISTAVIGIDLGYQRDRTVIAAIDALGNLCSPFRSLSLVASDTAEAFKRIAWLLSTPAQRRRETRRFIRETVAARRLEKMTNRLTGESA